MGHGRKYPSNDKKRKKGDWHDRCTNGRDREKKKEEQQQQQAQPKKK